MDIGETKIFTEFFISDSKIHVVGQGASDFVIDIIIGLLVAIEEGWDDGDEGDNKDWEDVDDELGGFVKRR